MNEFEDFWLVNQDKYKTQALKDFDKLNKGQYVASVFINTDDDFSLNISESFKLYGKNKKDLVKNLIEKLQFADFTYCKTWGVIDIKGNQTKGDYSHTWFSIRDEAIKELKSGSEYISHGGNQTIEITISPNIIAVLNKTTKKIKPWILKKCKNKNFIEVRKDGESLRFVEQSGKVCKFYHDQDYCERVYIESIIGDLSDLVGSPLLKAEESSRKRKSKHEGDSSTWTFYKFATLKGYVDVRWLGKTNDYYSESVHLEINKPTNEEKKLIEIHKMNKKLEETLNQKQSIKPKKI